MRRGTYGEVIQASLPHVTRKFVVRLMDDIQKAEKVDEHGSWDFRAEFDSKGRGESLNWDLYGVGRDCHSNRLLAVIQVRRWRKRRRRGFAEVHKSYFLCGRNEDQTAFAHPVESRVIHSAIKADRSVIRACQDWIFQADYSKMVRQGDFALLPARAPKDAQALPPATILQGSHYLIADRLERNGALYAQNPSLLHLPATHPDIHNLKGWYRVVEGRRGQFYNFAAPTVD